MINAKWLSEKQWQAYQHACIQPPQEIYWLTVKRSFESIAASRELMKKHQWKEDEKGVCYCRECRRNKVDGCKPDCAWAKHIAGYPREVE